LKLALHQSTWWGLVDDVAGIRAAKEIGFDAYDLFPGRSLSVTDAKFFRETFKEVGLTPSALTVVGSALSDFNAPVRKHALGWIKGQLDVANDIGCEMMVLALGGYEWEGKELDPKIQWGWAVEGVSELGDHAKETGMKVAIEMNPYELYVVHSLDTMLRFLRAVAHHSVGANADVSHLHLSHDPPERLRELGSRIIHVHLSDNNGKVHGDLPPGRGTAPLREYLRVLKGEGFRGAVTVELEFSPEPAKIREWVKEAYDASAGMMKELKVRG
jgi:D-psicose/D-tagatose/L-ribulose 3-epimerase